MNCMDCGKEIMQKRRAPSGSMIPRCADCNQKRWKQCGDDEKRLGVICREIPGQVSPIDDPWG